MKTANYTTTAPETFHQIMCNILNDIEGVDCLKDDVLIFAATEEKLYRTMKEAGRNLNKQKCKFEQSKVTFLDYLVTENGLEADTANIEAIE